MQHFYDGSNMVICGMSNSGKTCLVKDIIEHSGVLFEHKPDKILFIFKHWQSIYESIESQNSNVKFSNQIPEEDELMSHINGSKHSMIICDDMMAELCSNSFILSLFTRLSHHLNISTILLLQSHTIPNKFSSILNKNCHYTILMRSPRDAYAIRTIGLQLNDYKKLMSAYKDATSCLPFTYLLIDCHPKSDVKMRYKSKILPTDDACVVYL